MFVSLLNKPSAIVCNWHKRNYTNAMLWMKACNLSYLQDCSQCIYAQVWHDPCTQAGGTLCRFVWSSCLCCEGKSCTSSALAVVLVLAILKRSQVEEMSFSQLLWRPMGVLAGQSSLRMAVSSQVRVLSRTSYAFVFWPRFTMWLWYRVEALTPATFTNP